MHERDGRFLRVSEDASAVLGIDPAAVRGARLTDAIAADDHAAALSALDEAARTGFSRFEARAAGGRPLEVTLTRTDKGFRSVLRDVSDRASRDAALRAESLDAAWFAAKRTEHLVNVSHEIRTPLGAVIGFADALRQDSLGTAPEARVQDYARVIHDSGQHLLGLVTDLLDLSKAEANEVTLNREPTDLGALVTVCADIVRLQAESAGLYVRCDVPSGLPLLLLDPKIVRQIMLNLLSNALKFTAKGGVSVRVEPLGGEIRVVVEDTGVGMSPGDLKLVGRRFKQARAEGVRGARGTGIGLSLSQALARVHGGELELASTEGQGTTATVTLPFEAVAGANPLRA
nr:HAMP domain-containing sensor histidine kinase [Parvularcula dongshanensis]